MPETRRHEPSGLQTTGGASYGQTQRDAINDQTADFQCPASDDTASHIIIATTEQLITDPPATGTTTTA